MKVIDLLDLIAKGKEVPNKIKYRDEVWIYDNKNQDYVKYNKNDCDMFGYFFCNLRTLDFINDQVKILDDEYIKKQREHRKNLLNKLAKNYDLAVIEKEKLKSGNNE